MREGEAQQCIPACMKKELHKPRDEAAQEARFTSE